MIISMQPEKWKFLIEQIELFDVLDATEQRVIVDIDVENIEQIVQRFFDAGEDYGFYVAKMIYKNNNEKK